jgi:uncharacterized membrane protein
VKTFEVNHEIVVKAPVQKTFDVWTDFEHWPELYPDVYDTVKVTREGDLIVTDEIIKTIAGKQDAKIETKLESPNRYERRFVAGNMEGTTRTTTFEETPEGTLVKTHMNVQLGGVAAMLIGDLAETIFLKNIDKLSKAHARVAEGVAD